MDTLTAPTEVKSDFGYGMIGGIIGGAAFGILMQLAGIMTTYATIIGGSKDIDAWFIHILVSAVLGALYGYSVYRVSKSWLIGGLLFGFALWILGSLIVKPILMGNALFTFDAQTWWALLGSLIYGVITSGIFSAFSR